eukprot:CAMPEP_0197003358 /NCGR_PEP_ID=MMETSP1380-20130617/7652_1 /TAXON_ID=5936 /ORGANISM="Euplotes crassus, Strain CT5" /LENGTH=150 /DNA_ID=CAMNT_0042421845 /DNA_START=196 /DNA_END=648 /DNA_ORIENTATION=-
MKKDKDQGWEDKYKELQKSYEELEKEFREIEKKADERKEGGESDKLPLKDQISSKSNKALEDLSTIQRKSSNDQEQIQSLLSQLDAQTEKITSQEIIIQELRERESSIRTQASERKLSGLSRGTSDQISKDQSELAGKKEEIEEVKDTSN